MLLAQPYGDAIGLGPLVYPARDKLMLSPSKMKEMLPPSMVKNKYQDIEPARPAFLRV